MKKSALSDLTVGPALESSFPAEKLRQIIVPVDLTNDCTASIDYAIRFANAFGSTLNLLHLYQEPYVVNQRNAGSTIIRQIHWNNDLPEFLGWERRFQCRADRQI